MTSLEYWAQRQERAQNKLSKKAVRDIEKQLAKYYGRSAETVINEFIAVLDRLLVTVGKDKEPTPADLYKLDKFWKMQGQLKIELEKLGNNQYKVLFAKFTEQYQAVYEAAALPSQAAFATISKEAAQQAINQIWCADGKTWSQRIWGNIDRLQQTLNDGLTECVVTGKKSTELKEILQQRFNVSYGRADTLVRTEIANIQTQAAAKRYQDYGLRYYEFLGREEHDGCGHEPDCHELNGKKFLYAEMQVGVNAPPMHPNCKCAIIPVIEE